MVKIVYEDKNIIAVNKPPGIVVFHEEQKATKEDCLSTLLVSSFPSIKGVGGARNGAVHRLDKDTSGIILFAKNEKSLLFLQRELLEQRAKKRYITLVFKTIRKDEGEIRTFIDRSPKNRRKQRAHKSKGKRDAITFFKVITRFSSHSLLEVWPKTGRKHQIRCHLSHIGHPVAGDNLYGFKDQKDPLSLKRLFLHAESIEINTLSGKKIFSAPLAPDLQKVLDKLI